MGIWTAPRDASRADWPGGRRGRDPSKSRDSVASHWHPIRLHGRTELSSPKGAKNASNTGRFVEVVDLSVSFLLSDRVLERRLKL